MMTWNKDFIKLSPLFLPLQQAYSRFGNFADWPNIRTINQAKPETLVNANRQIINFIPQAEKAENFLLQYEPRIYHQGEIQTRANNWHDFFNAMVWFIFPKIKAKLNELQYQELNKRQEISGQRSALENTLTLFDENGLIVISEAAELLSLIKNHQWHELFWQRRSEVKNKMRFIIFGHSLYEKALNPYLGMTASSILLSVNQGLIRGELPEQIKQLDEITTNQLSQSKIKTTKDLTPLPILGIPGWDCANEQESYYHNKQYFRNK